MLSVQSGYKHALAAIVGAALSSRGRLAVLALGALTLMIPTTVFATPAAQTRIATAAATASSPWLDRLNAWRASTGLSNLTEVPVWSQGDYNHAVYMVKNDLVTHYETPGVPYYTTAGDVAAQNSNIYVSSTTSTTDTQAIDWWMQAPFHSMGLMDPRLTATGFGSYREVKSGWQLGAAVDTLRGNSWSGGQYPVYFPGNGTTEPLVSYSGGEFPDPLQSCPGYSVPTGLPVFVQVGGNVATSASASSFTGNGVALAHCVIDSNNEPSGSNLSGRGGVILIPQQPLQTGVKYAVSLTVNGAAYSWSFTVGPFVTSTTPCTTAGLTSDIGSPQNPGSVVTFTATSTGCPNPQYLYYLQSPDGAWTIARGYGGGTWAWNTSGLALGNYLVDVWVRDAGSGAAYQALHLLPFTLGSIAACTGAGLTADRTSPQQIDFPITFTASSTGCPNPEYLYYLASPGTGWALARGYGGPTWVWDTTTLATIGTYTVDVWVRAVGSGGAYQTLLLSSFIITNRVCSTAGLTSDKASPQAHGAVITFTATSAGCARPEYLFYLSSPGTGWAVARGYGGPTWAWSTAGVASIGPYIVDVWVRAAGSGAPYQTVQVIPYTLT